MSGSPTGDLFLVSCAICVSSGSKGELALFSFVALSHVLFVNEQAPDFIPCTVRHFGEIDDAESPDRILTRIRAFPEAHTLGVAGPNPLVVPIIVLCPHILNHLGSNPLLLMRDLTASYFVLSSHVLHGYATILLFYYDALTFPSLMPLLSWNCLSARSLTDRFGATAVRSLHSTLHRTKLPTQNTLHGAHHKSGSTKTGLLDDRD
jgi:hypothetical protein